MPDESVLSVAGIDKRFSGVHALDDVSLSVYPGRVHCIAGENGSGKSTLIKIISGVEEPDVGTITLDGRTYRSLTPRAAIRHGIQIIYQDLSLFPNLTLAENIAIVPMIAERRQRYSGREAMVIAQRVLESIKIDLPLRSRADQVSIVQRQLAAICRALAQDARILFMDEPTAALTRREVDLLFTVVERLRDRGVAIVFVSHKFNEVLHISDEITVLRNGRVVAEGPVAEFNPIVLSTAMTGREVTTLKRRQQTGSADEAEVALSAERVTVAGRLHKLSLQVRRGEILGVTGLLGSGRDAVAEALFGIHPISTGVIRVDGTPRVIHDVYDAIAAGIGYVPGDRLSEGLFLDQSIARNVVAASTGDIPRTAGLLLGRTLNSIATRLVDEFDIKTNHVQNPVRTLSGGNQQRVVLAKWFVRKPRVLILNGPTVGVDIGSKHEIMKLLRDLSASGTAIIVISDDVSELVQVADRLIVMRDGAIATEISKANINEERILRELTA